MTTQQRVLTKKIGSALSEGSYLFSDVEDLGLLAEQNYRHAGATDLDDEEFQALISSIKEEGVLEDVVVARVRDEGAEQGEGDSPAYKFRLIQGHRRLAAVKHLKERYPARAQVYRLPVKLQVKGSELSQWQRDELDVQATVSNYVRRRDDIVERALLYKKVREAKGGSLKETYESLGVDKKTVSSVLNILALPKPVLSKVTTHVKELKETFVTRLAQDYKNTTKALAKSQGMDDERRASELAAAEASALAKIEAALNPVKDKAGSKPRGSSKTSSRSTAAARSISVDDFAAFLGALEKQLSASNMKKVRAEAVERGLFSEER